MIQVSHRWNGGNPIIKMEDIFEKELNGIYEIPPDILQIPEEEKNTDGTLNTLGLQRVSTLTWSNYSWKCNECNRIFKDISNLEQHFKDDPHNKKFTYSCQDCSLTFRSYFSCQNHIVEVHKTYLKFCCDICSGIFIISTT